MKVLRSVIALGAIFWAAHGMAQEKRSEVKVIERVTLRQFNARLENIITGVAQGQGAQQREAQRLAAQAVQRIGSQLKSSQLDPYLDARTLKSAESPETSDGLWLDVGEMIVAALGHAPDRVLMIDQVNDLRLTSHVMPGSQILLLARDVRDFGAKKAQLVAETAKSLGLKIHVIWLSPERDRATVTSAQNLAAIVGATGGSFLEF